MGGGQPPTIAPLGLRRGQAQGAEGKGCPPRPSEGRASKPTWVTLKPQGSWGLLTRFWPFLAPLSFLISPLCNGNVCPVLVNH
jgi:hypothetical protein